MPLPPPLPTDAPRTYARPAAARPAAARPADAHPTHTHTSHALPRYVPPTRARPTHPRCGSSLTLVACLLVALTSCARVDVVAEVRGGPPLDAGLDATVDAAPDGGARDGGFCEGAGPLVLVGDGPGESRCGGAVVQTTFRYALCTCDGLALSHMLTTDAFDSRRGAWTPGTPGGSVGTNRSFAVAAGARVGGSLVAEQNVELGLAPLDVAGSIRCGGELFGSGPITVGKDVFAGRGVRVSALAATGAAHVPDDAPYEVRDRDEVRLGVVRGPVDVAPPCDCDPAQLLDVAGVVDAYREANDNAAAGLADDALATGDARALTLDCGRYYLDRIGGGSVELVVRGRVALFVGGDVALDRTFEVSLERGGELDLFIAGNVVSGGAWTLGDPTSPARLRLYVGGAGTIDLTSGGELAANVYAPRAELVTPAALEVFGSVFARRVVASGPLALHYDEAVLDVGADCPAPDRCATCRDCGNQACVDGACGLCRSDGDCCAPLVCAAGRCINEPF
ncbi:MAG: hypothetical protein KF901_02120 [Myxococcales bacterium]|nr:hypothetical protein [Myxococcales bacterium]